MDQREWGWQKGDSDSSVAMAQGRASSQLMAWIKVEGPSHMSPKQYFLQSPFKVCEDLPVGVTGGLGFNCLGEDKIGTNLFTD